MADHTKMSWKNENAISQLRNSVDNVTAGVEDAQSHPNEKLIQQAQNSLERAERSVENALQKSGHLEPIERLQEQLDLNKEKLQQLSSLKKK